MRSCVTLHALGTADVVEVRVREQRRRKIGELQPGAKIKGKKPNAGSVMDYTPVNIRMKAGKIQGDFTMHFDRYEEAPPSVAQQVMAAHAAAAGED